ncbi:MULTISPECIES: hypothetical protein [Haloarcula]|uniref:hypothetical protein n=1 Tax=Haloarcula TaxID=2237 RepID=UPI0023E8E1FE|nr:hypothetical protein [Halomicroarcula sp. SHR3]
MPDDLPSDVHAVLTQLLDETEAAIQAEEFDTVRQTIETATTVSQNKLPESDRRAQLLHGCGAVTAAIAAEDGVDADLTIEYVRAMAQRLPQ